MQLLYIHSAICISPQETFSAGIPEVLNDAVENKLHVIEPSYQGVAPSVLRRFGKASRIGIGAAMPLLGDIQPDGIVIGTANGGMEESIRFLKQIVEYNEDMLAPGSFVQSTANAIASQMGMITKNHGYNITHVHKAHAFENAVIDVAMLLAEQPENSYLLGAADEIGTYNYNIEYGAGWYKTEAIQAGNLYTSQTPGSIAGEGAAMFLVNAQQQNSIATLSALDVFQHESHAYVAERLRAFLAAHFERDEQPDLFISGENGDFRFNDFFEASENCFDSSVAIARYKHMSGEYPTASSFALWLACRILQGDTVPSHMIKRNKLEGKPKTILLYNFYQGFQHSFMLVR